MFGEGLDSFGRGVGEKGLVFDNVVSESGPKLLFRFVIRRVRDIAGTVVFDVLEAGVPDVLLKDLDRLVEVRVGAGGWV